MADQEHIVIVTFQTTAENQTEALEKIGAYVAGFLSRQPGFIGSELHRGLDGTSIVHRARWTCESDFAAAGKLARSHPDLPALMAYQPQGRGYTVWSRY
jgi:heme-degrading monooxygenase HmoA